MTWSLEDLLTECVDRLGGNVVITDVEMSEQLGSLKITHEDGQTRLELESRL